MRRSQCEDFIVNRTRLRCGVRAMTDVSQWKMSNENQQSGYVDNWQAGKTVTECNLHMLTTEDCSDVIFRAGAEKQVVRAHRYVLVSRSCVFHAMFCGPLAEKGEVTIPDIEPNIFKEFLRYVYTDTATITAETATGLLYTSRKYDVDGLFKSCATFLEDSLSEENVCQILEQCHGYAELDLEQKALKILTEATEMVIKSSGFLSLCSCCLGKFLSSDHLQLKEKEIVEAVVSWSAEKCKRENVANSPENLRKYLGDGRYEIRFSELSLEYLVDVIRPSGILTEMERINIMDNIIRPGISIAPFKSGPRKRLKIRIQNQSSDFHIANIFTTLSHGSWAFSDYAISFLVSKDINLLGCQLYGPKHIDESVYRLNILLYDNQNRMIAEPVQETSRNLRGQEQRNDIIFPDPIQIASDRLYTLLVKVFGENYRSYGEGGQPSTLSNGITFTFRGSLTNPDGGRIDRGVMPGLLWK